MNIYKLSLALMIQVLAVGVFAWPKVGLASEDFPREVILKVFELGTGLTLRRAEIVIIREDSKTAKPLLTNNLGSISLKLQAGDSRIRVSRSGFESQEVYFSDFKNQDIWKIYLEPAQPADNEVIIRGSRRKAISKKVISIEEAKAVAPRGDPAQITKLLPGVQSAGFTPEVVVRGSAPEDSKYLIDGIEIPFVFHTIGGISVIPEKSLQDVDFSAGAFDVRYGEAVGGVINLRSSDQPADKDTTQVKINLPFYSGVYHEQPVGSAGNESISLSARRSYLDVFISKLASDETVIVPIFWDSHIRYIKKDGREMTKVLALASLDGLKVATDGSGNDDGRLTFDISTFFAALGLTKSGVITKKWTYTASPQIVYTEVNNAIIDNDIKIRGPRYKLPIEFSYRIHRSDKLYLGLDVEHSSADVDILAPLVAADDPFADFEEAPKARTKIHFSSSLYATWIAYDWRLADSVVLTPALRATYYSLLDQSVLDPRIKVIFKPTLSRRFSAAIGQYSKSPDPAETSEVFGNPELSSEHSVHYVLGWNERWSERWESDLQLYLKRNYNMVRSSAVSRYSNDGEQRSYGAEIFLRRNRTSRAFGWLAYTYSVTEQRKSANEVWLPYEFDQTHNVNLVAGYHFSGRWSMGGRVNFHTGDRYTPINEAVYNSSVGKYQPRYDIASEFAARLPDYWQIDIYNVYDFLFNTWRLKFRSGIEYLAPERPAFGVSYNYDYSKKSYFRGVPPIPYLELSGEF